MEFRMKYAEVSVNSPVAQRRAFSYSIPEGLSVLPGQAVLVPFGEKVLQGVVMELTALPAVEDTRDIIGIINATPVLSPAHIALAKWISEYYLSPLFDAVALMLPPGFERQAIAYVSPARQDIDIPNLDDTQKQVTDMLAGKTRVEQKKIEKALGQKKAAAAIKDLIQQDLVLRSYELASIRIKPKTELYIKLGTSILARNKLSAKQAALLAFLNEVDRPAPWVEVRRKTGAPKAAAAALVKLGLALMETREVKRSPVSYDNITLSFPLTLTPGQEAVFNTIQSEIGNPAPSDRIFLLKGVTASGKTEVYLQLLAETVKHGKKGIVLVPEIALTPQTIERFASRFAGKVGVMHSRLSLGEQYDEWRRVQSGEYDVVIGSRSALFAPQPNLGLIIIDEEHEWTYKQDNVPHHHARAAAIKLSELTGAVVVLGSATPDVEDFFKAKNGTYKLLELKERVVPTPGASLPPAEIVDMRGELKAGNTGMFSRSLHDAIKTAIATGGQVILFLNRRGGAYYIQCRHCGYVLRCRRCDVPLSHHSAENMLICHQCNYKARVPEACPNCHSRELKYLGAGTQKLEEEVKKAFPGARQLRWDSDTTANKNESSAAILKKFRNRQADILIGTQMIAKGLDIPSVTLVGVINADSALNLPDFRAVERTFQLLTQVAGRAGRGTLGGRVIIQTFSPENYAIKAAALHDYDSFYEKEIEYRHRLHLPPFTQLARLSYYSSNDDICRREMEKKRNLLLEQAREKGVGGVDIIGPAPAFIHKLRGKYRWQLVLRGQDLSAFLAPLSFNRGWMVDIDPMGLIQ
jgi:primosomal protein N' (replication factor Y) (superfamily II helicase)